MRCYCTPTRMDKTKENGNGQPLVKMRNSQNYPALLERSINWYKHPGKLRQHLPTIGLSYDPEIQLPKYTYMNVYNSLFANSQNLEVILRSKHWGHLGSCVEAELEVERQKAERVERSCGRSQGRKGWWQHQVAVAVGRAGVPQRQSPHDLEVGGIWSIMGKQEFRPRSSNQGFREDGHLFTAKRNPREGGGVG